MGRHTLPPIVVGSERQRWGRNRSMYAAHRPEVFSLTSIQNPRRQIIHCCHLLGHTMAPYPHTSVYPGPSARNLTLQQLLHHRRVGASCFFARSELELEGVSSNGGHIENSCAEGCLARSIARQD